MEGIRPDNNAIPSSEGMKEFTANVQIDGLPFIFKGQIEEASKSVRLTLYIPNWQGVVAEINKELSPPPELVNEGEIGYVALDEHDQPNADVYIPRIRSYTEWLPKESRYHFENVHVGRFLMSNALAYADMKGWRVTAFAYTDGRLQNDDVYDWLERKGFPSPMTPGGLVRQPQSPDLSQPITKLVN